MKQIRFSIIVTVLCLGLIFNFNDEVIAIPLEAQASRLQILEKCGQDARVPRQNPDTGTQLTLYG